MAMQATRQEILDYLRRHGRGSVKDLGELLGLTSTGIRQHLTVLERDGLIEGREERGRVGRPALVYALSNRGHSLYPKKYDVLAAALIEEVKAMVGARGLQKLMRNVAARFSEPYLGRMEGKGLGERVEEVARIIEEEGCLVETAAKSGEFVLFRYTCPLQAVAVAHTVLCAMDTEFVRRLTGAEAKLKSCIARGDPLCIYTIREVSPSRAGG
jgi:predicted ArsR family transcriptional regulator